MPDEFRCSGCRRPGSAADVVAGWSLSTPPRPTGSTPGVRRGPTTALCPACSRRAVRDLEARLDP